MIQPSPTSRLAPELARGTLVESLPATATRPAVVKVAIPNSSYELHLAPKGHISVEPGRRIVGVITAEARRLDVVDTGGRYVEPVCGRPRRVQGRVVATDDAAGTVLVNAGVPIHLRLTAPGQRPSGFAVGAMVSCDVRDGATFEPQART